ncbi:MAG TPA: 23S rRNA methyltransferase [Rhodospirillaceae bacterium]|nr:MAG: 23S rRNA methyltransferase [Alphaproteobacteria bacterium GWF2_58_20]HAU29933.1 23S rRNA methyltransferase [Rhodospirillaceae bacterium]
MTQKNPHPSRRMLSVRVKTAAKRKISSTRWLARQLNDPYVQEAKSRGFRSRAAFKLEQLDDKYSLLKPGMKVVDLGAAPGGWTQIAVARAKPAQTGGCVVGIDLLPIDPIPDSILIEGDFMEGDAPDKLKTLIGGEADFVMSDMAPYTMGHRQTDHLRVMALVEAAYAFAFEVLKPGGIFLAKLFQGNAEEDLLRTLKRDFEKVRHVKPDASRKESSEVYVLATGFRGKHPS